MVEKTQLEKKNHDTNGNDQVESTPSVASDSTGEMSQAKIDAMMKKMKNKQD